MSYLIAQKYLLFLIGVMISAGIIKEKHYLDNLFYLIKQRIKSKRLVVFLVSFFSGILPIPGRVTVSAGILDSLAPSCSSEDKSCKKSRAKFGIIDYLSTHHYYLWSPLEKTVILPMAALGITWSTFMGYMWPLVLISFIYIFSFIFIKFKEDDIIINENLFQNFNISKFIFGTLPLFIAIGFLAFGFPGWIVFPVVAFYYMIYGNIFNIKQLNSYINWWLVGILAIVLILSVFFKSHAKEIGAFITSHGHFFDIHTLVGFIAISSIVFAAAWLMGSSGKYAGLVAILLGIYGPSYLVWFLTLEFAAYNLSPMHKCVHIGRMYFGTKIRRYFEAIIIWQLLLLTYAGIYTYFLL